LKKVMAIMVCAIILGMATVASAQMGPAQMGPAQTGQAQKNLFQAASDSGSFGMFTKAVQDAGMKDTLSTGGPYTAFAMTDDALGKTPQGLSDSYLKGKMSAKWVKNHIAQGRYTTKDLESMSSITTLNGDKLPVRSIDGKIYVGSMKLIGPEIQSNNGIVHGVTISGFS